MNLSMKFTYPVLLILGLSLSLEGKLPFLKKSIRVPDPAQSQPLVSRLPCDGHTSPEDHPVVKTSFSSGGWIRSFAVSVFRKEHCRMDVKGKCLDKAKESWQDVWSTLNTDAKKTDQLSLRSCYAWASAERPTYVLSGWYKEAAEDPKNKLVWKQAKLTKVS